MAVEVDIEPLVVADELIFQVDGFYGENLRVDQNVLWQCHIEASKGFLCVAGNQAAAGFAEAGRFRAENLLIQCGNAEFGSEQARQCRTGRAKADDGDIVMGHKKPPL